MDNSPDNAPPQPRQKLLIDLAIVAALVGLGVAGYQLAPLLTPRADVTLPLSSCDLNRSPCTIELPEGGKVELTISPRPIPVLKPLKIQATVSNGKVRKMEIDFAGVDMKMGLNRPQLTDRGNGRFEGEANLPVCVTGGMAWEATLIIEAAGTVVSAPFRFVTEGG